MAISAAAVSRRNAGGIVVDLMLEDFEGSVRRLSNDHGNFPVREGRKRCLQHTGTVCRLYEDSVQCGMERCDAGMKTWSIWETREVDIALLPRRKSKLTMSYTN
jgi:hypothetical protein